MAQTIHFTAVEPTYITPIDCPHCNSKAHLIRRSPAVTSEGEGEMRTFECFDCEAQTEMFIRDESSGML